MARLVVDAAIQPIAQDVRLVVSVSGANDGLPRGGLAPTNFAIVAMAPDEDTSFRQQSIARALEGPAGVYQIELAPDTLPATLAPRMIVLAIAVSGDSQSGWADDQGQSIVIGTMP